MAERGDCGFARRQTVLREQVGNRTIRGALLTQLRDDLFCWNQVLELLWPARCKFRDSFTNFMGIKSGHRMNQC